MLERRRICPCGRCFDLDCGRDSSELTLCKSSSAAEELHGNVKVSPLNQAKATWTGQEIRTSRKSPKRWMVSSRISKVWVWGLINGRIT
jgi:hypothetical protein